MSFNPIPQGGEFNVNSTTANAQSGSSVTGLADGGYVVTWNSTGQDASAIGVFAQRYDADGGLVGGEFQVNTYETSFQYYPSVAGLDDGGFVVTWISDGQDADGYGIFAQRYTAAGAVSGGEFQVNSHTSSHQQYPSVAALGDGGFIVTWHSLGQDGDLTGVYAQRYTAAGATDGAEFMVNTTTQSAQQYPSVTGLDDGGFVVTWQSSAGGAVEVIGQIYNAAGAAVGGEFQINTYTFSAQVSSSVTALNDGGFVVTWQSNAQDGSFYGVYGQRYDAAGATVGAEFQINDYVNDTQYEPSITGLADGGFVVAWTTQLLDGFGTAVYGQRYDAAGATVGGQFQVNTYVANLQDEPAISALENGGFVVTWTSGAQDGSGDGVYGQQYAAQLFGTSGADTMSDSVGANWMHGQDGADVLKGLGGADTIKGGGGNDRLIGGGGADRLSGGSGIDRLLGGKGDDKLTGGAGSDKFIFKLGYGRDKIMDFEDDIDTFRLNEDLWGGGLTKQQMIDAYASIKGGDIVFDFGGDELRLKGFTDLTELKDDMVFI